MTSEAIFGAQGDLYATIWLFIGHQGFQVHFDGRILGPTLMMQSMVIFECFPFKADVTHKGHKETPSYHVINWDMGNGHASRKNHHDCLDKAKTGHF